MSSPFDTKLEHVLSNYLSANGVNHDIRKAFIHEQIFTFEEFFCCCDVENIKTFQRDNGTTLVQAFSNSKLKMIGNVLLYCLFLMNDSQEVLAQNPVNWVKGDFIKWKTKPRGTAIQNAATQYTSNMSIQQASNVPTTAPVVIRPITAPVVIRTKIVSTKEDISNEDKSNEDIVSNLDDVAVADDDVAIDNVNIHSNTVAVPTTASNFVSNKEVVTAREIRTDLNDVEIVSNEEEIPVPITTSSSTTVPKIVSDEKGISGNPAENGTYGVADDDDTVATTTTTPVFTDIESNGEIVPKDVAAAADDIDNAESPKIGDLDGINDEYYHADGKYCSVYDRSNDDNPPSLPPESPANAIDIQCIHSNIPNNGEITSLPLFSSVYRVKQSDQMENDGLHNSPKAITDFPTHDNSSPGFWYDADDDEIDNVDSETSVGRDYGANDDTYNGPGPNQANYNMSTIGERIVLPSSVSRVVKDNGEIVEGSRRYDLKVISKEPENVSSNLYDVSATTTTTTAADDDDDNEVTMITLQPNVH